MPEFLTKTMDVPAPYGLFHIVFAIFGIAAAYVAARPLCHISNSKHRLLLFAIGVVLLLSEAAKQIFYNQVIDRGAAYTWWIFPFQLCSLPMYLCPIAAVLPRDGRAGRALCTFLMDFGLLGGIMVFAAPSGMLHGYWFLTLHAFLWHIILIFLGFYLGFSGQWEKKITDYRDGAALYLIFCMIATILNLALDSRGEINLFYINPLHPTTQIVFSYIAAKLGILASNLSYILCTLSGALLIHLSFTCYGESRHKQSC